MAQWQGKSQTSKLGYQIFVFLLRFGGLVPAYILLRFVALYFLLFSRTSTRHNMAYFKKRHHYGTFKAWIHSYKNYYVFGQTLIDKVVVMSGVKNPFTFDMDGVDNLRQMVAEKRGGILLSGHAGNWEIAGHMLKILDAKVNIVMFDGEHQQIKQYLDGVTGARSFNIIVIREDLSHVYRIGEALQKNELVCLHADRFVPGSKTITRNFLNAPADFPAGPFAIAATFNAPVSFVYAAREKGRHYYFYGSPLMRRHPDMDKRTYADVLANDYITSFEKIVYKYPDQWFNYYNFWKD